VRDLSHPDTDAQKADVELVMKELGLDEERLVDSLIEVRNKADLLDAEEREVQANLAKRADHPVVVMSAVTGQGVDDFLATVEDQLSRALETLELRLEPADGKTLAWLYAHGEVIDRRDEDDGVHVTVRLEPANARRFEQIKPSA